MSVLETNVSLLAVAAGFIFISSSEQSHSSQACSSLLNVLCRPGPNDSDMPGPQPGELAPSDISIQPVPEAYDDGYGVYGEYGYAEIGAYRLIVDLSTRRIVNSWR